MRRLIVCFTLVCLLQFSLQAELAESAEPAETEDVWSPPLNVFHNFGNNLLGSFTHNYGLNFVAAGLGTWGIIKTGIDWEWRNLTYNNAWIANMGVPILAIGYVAPVLAPLTMYLVGRSSDNKKLISAAAALTQAQILVLGIQSPIKMITGRVPPGVISGVFFEPQPRDDRTEDFSDEFRWFNMNFNDGWPSDHTALAFSAAGVLSEIYHDNLLVKIIAYTYAALMGISVGSNVHWASDVFAGALIGYAIGKTVGRSFARPSAGTEDISLSFSMNAIGVTFRI